MSRWLWVVVGACLIGSLGGCDVAPALALHNGVGRTFRLTVTKGGRPPESVTLKRDGVITVRNIYGPELRLTADRCEYRYSLPYMDMNHPWRIADAQGGSQPDYHQRYPVHVQIAPDFSLRLMPSLGKGVSATADDWARAQAHDYPLRPTSSDCR